MTISLSAYKALRLEIADIELAIARETRVKERPDFDGLVIKWDRFAAYVERGDPGSVDDFAHALWQREELEQFVDRGSPGLVAFVALLTRAADRTFRASTSEAPDWGISRYIEVGPGWWWTRRPNELGGLASNISKDPTSAD